MTRRAEGRENAEWVVASEIILRTGNLTIFRAVVKNDGRDERQTLEEPLWKRFR